MSPKLRHSPQDLELEELKKNWTWDRVYGNWQRRVTDFVSFASFDFVTVQVFDPKSPTGRSPVRCWWSRQKLQELQLEFQRHLDAWPGTLGPVNDYSSRRGELDTVTYLDQARGNEQVTSAILLAGSLFARTESSRARFPAEYWPSRACASHLHKVAISHCKSAGLDVDWHYSCTDVLPYASEDYHYKLEDMDALVRYLAEEHAVLFLRYAVVDILFKSRRDPFVEKVLKQEYAERDARAREWNAKWKDEQETRRAADDLKRQKHPRFEEWHSLPASELERLVWSMPTVQVATLFGMSDVAIGKRCKAAGISKPPLGFWRRVEAGLLAHPNGKPMRETK